MGRFTIRTDDWMDEMLESISDESNMNKSEQIRAAYRLWVDEHGGEAPEWAQKEGKHEKIIRENNPNMRMLNFKQRCHEQFKQLLRNDDGKLARNPPEPTKVETLLADSLRREVREEYEEYEDEYLHHIDREMEWYSIMHPDRELGSKREQCVEYVRWCMKYDGNEQARKAVEALVNKDMLPKNTTKHDILDGARDRVRNKSWKDEWDDATLGREA